MEGRHSVCAVYLSVVLYLCLYCRTTSANSDRVSYACLKTDVKRLYLSCQSGQVIKIFSAQVGRSKDSCSSSCCLGDPACTPDIPPDSDVLKGQRDACDNKEECNVEMITLACGVPIKPIDFQNLFYTCVPYVPSSSTTSPSISSSITSTIKTSSTTQSRTSSSTPVSSTTSLKDVSTSPGTATEGTVGQTSADTIVSSTTTNGGINGNDLSSAASSSNSDLIIGAVAGIVGIVALIALVVACGICMRNRQKRKDASEYPRENSSRGPSLAHSSRQNNNHVYTSEMDMHSNNGRMSDIPQDGSGVGVRELETDVDSTPSGNPRQYEYAHNIERADNQRAGEQESEHSSEAIYSAVDKSRKSKHRNEEVVLAENDMYATRIT